MPSNLERKLNYARAQLAQNHAMQEDARQAHRHPFSTVHIRAEEHRLLREIASTERRLQEQSGGKRNGFSKAPANR